MSEGAPRPDGQVRPSGSEGVRPGLGDASGDPLDGPSADAPAVPPGGGRPRLDREQIRAVLDDPARDPAERIRALGDATAMVSARVAALGHGDGADPALPDLTEVQERVAAGLLDGGTRRGAGILDRLLPPGPAGPGTAAPHGFRVLRGVRYDPDADEVLLRGVRRPPFEVAAGLAGRSGAAGSGGVLVVPASGLAEEGSAGSAWMSGLARELGRPVLAPDGLLVRTEDGELLSYVHGGVQDGAGVPDATLEPGQWVYVLPDGTRQQAGHDLGAALQAVPAPGTGRTPGDTGATAPAENAPRADRPGWSGTSGIAVQEARPTAAPPSEDGEALPVPSVGREAVLGVLADGSVLSAMADDVYAHFGDKQISVARRGARAVLDRVAPGLFADDPSRRLVVAKAVQYVLVFQGREAAEEAARLLAGAAARPVRRAPQQGTPPLGVTRGPEDADSVPSGGQEDGRQGATPALLAPVHPGTPGPAVPRSRFRDAADVERAVERRMGKLPEEVFNGLVTRASGILQGYVALSAVPGRGPLGDHQREAVYRVALALHLHGADAAHEEALSVASEWTVLHPDRLRRSGAEALRGRGFDPAVLDALLDGDRTALTGGAALGPGTAGVTEAHSAADPATASGTDADGSVPPDTALLTLTGPAHVDTTVRSIGVPRAGLPDVQLLVAALRQAVTEALERDRRAGRPVADVPEDQWTELPATLLGNYPLLLPGSTPRHDGGLVLTIGEAEVLVTLDPVDPQHVAAPAESVDHAVPEPGPEGAGHRATESSVGSFNTGAHVRTTAGSTSATRLGMSAGFGIPGAGILHTVRVGGGVSFATNVSGRSTSVIADAENGHVENSREESLLLAYRPVWRFRVRTDGALRWSSLDPHTVPASGRQHLLLWVPRNYFGRPAGEQTAARVDRPGTVPEHHFTSGLSDVPQLFDALQDALRPMLGGRAADLLRIGSPTREKLLQGVYNLRTNLERATGSGYLLRLPDSRGRTVATIVIRGEALTSGGRPDVRRVGTTSSKRHIENVRTTISGVSGSHSLANSAGADVFAEADLVPRVLHGHDLGLGVKLSAGVSEGDTTTVSSGAIGLGVSVHRFTGPTNAYAGRFRFTADVHVLRPEGEYGGNVDVVSEVTLSMPVPEALAHGYPVDREPPAAPAAAPAADVRLPAHVADGEGIGLGGADVRQSTVDLLRQAVREAVGTWDFLPPQGDPFAGHGRLSYGPDLESRFENEVLLDKILSRAGLESRLDDLLGDGVLFVLQRQRGAAGVGFDVDTAEVTVRAALRTDRTGFTGTDDQNPLVHLSMGLDTAGFGAGASASVKAGLRFGVSNGRLRGSAVRVELQHSVSTDNSVTYITNLPMLAEYAGPLNRFSTLLDYTVTVRFAHSGLQGSVRSGIRNPEPIVLRDQETGLRLLPLRTDGPGEWVSPGPTPAHVLDTAVLYHLDTTGARAAAASLLHGDLLEPSSGALQRIAEITTNTHLRAHFKRILDGHYSDDQGFDPGLLRDSHVSLLLSAEVGPSEFVDASDRPFVLSAIKLWLSQASSSASTSDGITVGQFDVAVGDNAAPGVQSAAFDASRSLTRTTTEGGTVTGGTEQIPLSLGRAYLYRARARLTFAGGQTETGKLAPTTVHRAEQSLEGRTLLYLLSESDALGHYADGTLPVPPSRLADVMHRWLSGDLRLGGTLAARLLLRWRHDGTGLPGPVHFDGLASLVRQLHDTGASPVLDHEVLARFNAEFPEHRLTRQELDLPDHLTREDPGGRSLGHAGIRRITFDGGRALWDVLAAQIEAVAPGLITSGTLLADTSGLPVARVQGAVGALQAVFAPGRLEAAFADILSPHGLTVDVRQPVGWFLQDVVRVVIHARFTGAPEGRDVVPPAGLELYHHGQRSFRKGGSLADTQSLTPVKYAPEGTEAKGDGTLALHQGRQRGVTVETTTYTEQSAYTWSGYAELGMPLEVTLHVSRVDTAGGPLTAVLTRWYRSLAGLAEPDVRSLRGEAVVQVPMAVLRNQRLLRPVVRTATPLPVMPGTTTVSGTALDDALLAAQALVREVFGRAATDPRRQANPVLRTLLSPGQLVNSLLPATTGGPRLLAGALTVPGDPLRYATVRIRADLFDLQLLEKVEDSGTGRYTKDLKGVSTNTASSPWRPTVKADTAAFGTLPHTATGYEESVPWSRDTAQTGTQGDGQTPRGELHIKEQGPLYRVRVRVAGHLEATAWRRHRTPGVKPVRTGSYRSRRFTGTADLYLQAAHVEELLARQAESARAARPSARPWRVSARFQEFDLNDLLAEAARQPGATAGLASGAVSRMLAARMDHGSTRLDAPAVLRRRTRRPTELTTDAPALALRLDLDALRAEAARTGVRPPATVLREPAQALTDRAAPLLDADPVHLVRDVALTLGAYVRLDVRTQDGPQRTWWISPHGRMHAFDPQAFDDTDLDADTAVEAGLLSARTRRDLETWGVDSRDLGRFYRTSWDVPETFEAAVRREVDRRGARLASADPALPEVFAAALAVEASWRTEVSAAAARLALDTAAPAGRPASPEPGADLAGADLAEAQEQLDLASALVDRLRELAASRGSAPAPADLAASAARRLDGLRAELDRRGAALLDVPDATGEPGRHSADGPGEERPATAPRPASDDLVIPAGLDVFDFEEGRHTLGPVEADRLRRLARYLAGERTRRESRGTGMPPVVISTGGNGIRFSAGRQDAALETSGARGRHMADLLLAELDRYPGRRIEVRLRSRGRDVAGLRSAVPGEDVRVLRRRAFVEVPAALPGRAATADAPQADDGPDTDAVPHADDAGRPDRLQAGPEQSGPQQAVPSPDGVLAPPASPADPVDEHVAETVHSGAGQPGHDLADAEEAGTARAAEEPHRTAPEPGPSFPEESAAPLPEPDPGQTLRAPDKGKGRGGPTPDEELRESRARALDEHDRAVRAVEESFTRFARLVGARRADPSAPSGSAVPSEREIDDAERAYMRALGRERVARTRVGLLGLDVDAAHEDPDRIPDHRTGRPGPLGTPPGRTAPVPPAPTADAVLRTSGPSTPLTEPPQEREDARQRPTGPVAFLEAPRTAPPRGTLHAPVDPAGGVGDAHAVQDPAPQGPAPLDPAPRPDATDITDAADSPGRPDPVRTAPPADPGHGASRRSTRHRRVPGPSRLAEHRVPETVAEEQDADPALRTDRTGIPDAYPDGTGRPSADARPGPVVFAPDLLAYDFAEGEHRLARPAQARVVRLAGELARLAAHHEEHGLPLPRIVVTGGGSGGWVPGLADRAARAERNGRVRADDVARVLHNALDALGADRFEIVVGSRGRGDLRPGDTSAVRRRVLVSVVPRDPGHALGSLPPGTVPAAEHPWYVDRGMLGEATVGAADTWSREKAAPWARLVAEQVPYPALAAAVEAGVTDLLLTEGAEEWRTLLSEGVLRPAGGRLLWLRPVLRQVRPRPVVQADGPVRTYGVTFGSMAGAGATTRTTGTGVESVLFTALDVTSGAASAIVTGLPQVSARAARTRTDGTRRSLIAGRKLFTEGLAGFEADVQVLVFVDGERYAPDVVVPRRLEVDFPAVYSGPDALRPDPKPEEVDGVAPPRSRETREVLNALDATPLVSALLKALRDRGLAPEAAAEVVRRAQALLDERAARNHGPALFGGGHVSNPIRIGLTGFRGHVTVAVAYRSAQFLGVTEQVKVRDDMGGGLTRASRRGSEGAAAVAAGLTAVGVTGLHAGHAAPSGMLPLAGLTLHWGENRALGLSTTALAHTVLTTKEPQARYAVVLRVDVTVDSPTLGTFALREDVPAEVGLPWRDGRGAAHFEERVLGAVLTPAVAAAAAGGPGLRAAPGPVAAHPHVRVLLDLSGTRPTLAPLPPEPLPPAPREREPLVLAARRGLGFSVAVGLPGAELVRTHLRTALQDLAAAGGNTRADWARVDRDLVLHFGRPALEGDLANLLGGLSHTVTLGPERYRLSVRGFLREHRGVSTYPMTVNLRAAATGAVSGAQGASWGVRMGGGAALRLTLGDLLRLQLGGLRLQGGYTSRTGDALGGTVQSYRRTETLTDVDEHVYGIAYELVVRRLDGRPTTPVRSFLHHPDAVAQVAVPHEHAPERTSTAEEAAAFARPVYSRIAPGAGTARLALRSAGAAGVYPAFPVMPELPRLVASMHAQLADTPPGRSRAWPADWTLWPEELVEQTRPGELASFFGTLTGPLGHEFALPDEGGWRTTVRLRLTVLDPVDLGPTRGEVEIEQYSKSAVHHQSEAERELSADLSAMAGPQFALGGRAPAGPEDAGEHAPESGSGHASSFSGRLVTALHGEAAVERGVKEETDRGNIQITRATYGGATHVLSGTPHFEVTVTRWRSGRRQELTRHVRFDGALQALVPESRLAELMPAAGPAHQPSPAGPRAHLAGALVAGTAHAEHLEADGVLAAVVRRLVERGVLRARTGEPGPRPDLLLRSLAAAFSSEALKTGLADLLGSGVSRWFPVGNGFVRVRVTAVRVEPPHADRPRPDVKLTLRGEAVTEGSRADVAAVHGGGGVLVRVRLGDHDGHGGLEAEAGYGRRSSSQQGNAVKRTEIYRANPRDRSHAFSHHLDLRVEVGFHRRLPPLVGAPARAARSLVLGGADRAGAGPAVRRFWDSRLSRDWYDGGARPDDLVRGTVHLLVPAHLTVPRDEDAPPFTFVRSDGENPRPGLPWAEAQEPGALEVTDGLAENIHPLDVPAAHAAASWVRPAALDDGTGGPEALAGRGAAPAGVLPGALSEDPGPEFASLDSLLRDFHTSSTMLGPRTVQLLRGRYEVPVGDRTVRLRLVLTRAEVLGSSEGFAHKGRHYVQQDGEPTAEESSSSSWRFVTGPEGGGHVDDGQMLERLPFGVRDVARGERYTASLGRTDEHNREGVRTFRYYRFDTVLVVEAADGPRRSLRVDVPGGLVAMFPIGPDGALVDGLEDVLHPGTARPGGPAGASGPVVSPAPEDGPPPLRQDDVRGEVPTGGADPGPGSDGPERYAAPLPQDVVSPPPAADRLVRELPGMAERERAQVLEALTPGQRRWLARDTEFVRSLQRRLPPQEMAATAAHLLVHGDLRAHAPASARAEARAQVARMLQDPLVAGRLLTGGADVLVVPADVPATDLHAFRRLRGRTAGSGRVLDTVRGFSAGASAVTEENLLGGTTSVGRSPHYEDGYSTTTHEIAHAIHDLGLPDADRRAVADAYRALKEGGTDTQWPDGPRTDLGGNEVDNYSSVNAQEFFAQLSNAYLGTNHGTDPRTGRPRNNGAAWVRTHLPSLVPLLERLYGTDPSAVHPRPANPVDATRADEERYAAFRDFTLLVEAAAVPGTQDRERAPGASLGEASAPVGAATGPGSPPPVLPPAPGGGLPPLRSEYVREVEEMEAHLEILAFEGHGEEAVARTGADPGSDGARLAPRGPVTDSAPADRADAEPPSIAQRAMQDLNAFLENGLFSAARILVRQLEGRAERSRAQGGREYEEAATLHTGASRTVTAFLAMNGDEGHPRLRALPKVVNFFWIGRPLSADAVRNLQEWADRADRSGWRVQMWTDTGEVGGVPVSAWDPRVRADLVARGVRFREATELWPPVRPTLQGRLSLFFQGAQSSPQPSPRLEKLRDIYLNARTDRNAAPAASDVARYGLLLVEGGVYADVDIAPGGVHLPPAAPLLGLSDLPVIAPMIRDQAAYHHQRDDLARRRGVPEDQVTLRDVVEERWSRGEYNNNFLAVPPGSRFVEHLVDAIPEAARQMPGHEMVGNAAALTGPAVLSKAVFAQIREYGIGTASDTEVAAAVDPVEAARWIDLGWLTEESSNQAYEESAGAGQPSLAPEEGPTPSGPEDGRPGPSAPGGILTPTPAAPDDSGAPVPPARGDRLRLPVEPVLRTVTVRPDPELVARIRDVEALQSRGGPVAEAVEVAARDLVHRVLPAALAGAPAAGVHVVVALGEHLPAAPALAVVQQAVNRLGHGVTVVVGGLPEMRLCPPGSS
ncbi:hypothetical protein LO771_20935 [Streptacidiphilus sp. ASG 303]|uniref:glycosyltransferase n=1 Tax=Streptacidiphilus sp. ASG 303 TaxID=2896847 RepID=UPI001E5D9EAE|nr:glycosyltransferase [Streptacidiphilus sp. ASG 303]MCD0484791.1 hypothetical protein [Streptacidiphilus sp. ASG 303]